MSVRVRYAPSPTGSPHVGNIRDALFKHLLAKHHKGVNILRIEDTDRTRYQEGAERDIMESLHWMGIEWQEGPDVGGPNGPYRQSERKEAGIYANWIQVLLDQGAAYYAFESPQELEDMREYQQINRQPVGYFGGMWRDAEPAQVEAAKAAGKQAVIRQRIPRGKTVTIEDSIRGVISWDSDTVDDPVLIKADGMPTYHFAAMVDDHLMGITHIIRGEEWIASTPKHALLFDAFGWDRPVFVHCPVIKGKDGKKLSKRHGDTRCLDYRAAGYLPEALANFIALIGWSPGDDGEVLSMNQLVDAFDIGGLQPSPGIFDLEKLRWMNGVYIRQKPLSDLAHDFSQYADRLEVEEYFAKPPEEGGSGDENPVADIKALAATCVSDPRRAEQAFFLTQERVTTLADFGPASAFLTATKPVMDPKAAEKWLHQPHVGAMFAELADDLRSGVFPADADCFNPEVVGAYEALLRNYSAKAGFEKLGPVVHPVRAALTGKTAGPGLFELMAALGRDEVIRRLLAAKGISG